MRFTIFRHTRIQQRLLIAVCLASMLTAFSPVVALAWGPQGHRIIAEIAQQRLKPEVRQAILHEFSIKHLADVANWADQIKSKREETRPWHYCNIASGEFLYSRQRDCPVGNCVIEKILEFTKRLQDGKVKGRSRKEALSYLVHFVGDIHQPLHLGNAGDRGGNSINVIVHGERTNLHAVWDHDLIRRSGKSLVKYAAELSDGVGQGSARARLIPDVVGWANESRKLALHQGYLLEFNKRGELSRHYLEAGEQTVELQLKKAGVRLADLLNIIIKP